MLWFVMGLAWWENHRSKNSRIVVFIFYDFEKTVRKTGWSVRGFWVIIERFSRRSRENLEIITQKPRTDHPVFRTVCLRSLRMWNVLFLGSCFPSQVKKFFIAVKKTTHIQGNMTFINFNTELTSIIETLIETRTFLWKNSYFCTY